MTALPGTAVAQGGPCADDEGVTVVVDPNEIGGPDQVACAPDGGVAAELFAEAGVTLEYQPGLQDFVCRVDGDPVDRPCTEGDSYWSLWWAEPSGEWVYSSLGVRSLEVPDGGSLGFAWHEGEGDAAAPDVAVGGERAATTAATEEEAAGAAEREAGGGFPVWAAAALVVLVLGAALLVVLWRRRST